MQHSEFEKITKKMLPKTQIKPADLLIVFGTTYGIDLFVENVVSLYNNGYCKYILCTGGNMCKYHNQQYAESIIMKNLLVEKGVPENIILTEEESKNTGENLHFSLPMLEEKFGNIQNIKSIIGVGKIHGTLRFLMTMCKYFPNAEKMFFPINVFGCNEEYWYLNKTFREKLLAEAEKIEKYLQNGFIAPLDNEVQILPSYIS